MKKIKIFCEGITDQVFIKDCFKLFFGLELKLVPNKNKKTGEVTATVSLYNERIHIEVISVGGCTHLSNDYFMQAMRENSKEGGNNIVVFDADFAHNAMGDKQNTGNHGFESCGQKLDDIKRAKEVDFVFYLWPNDQEDGEIENLLLELIPKEKQPVLDCINSSRHCLELTQIQNLALGDLKTKFNMYLYTLKQKPALIDRDYTNPIFWNLDSENIVNLKKIKTFFAPFLVI
jgi:hypothetical protein